VIVKRSLHPLDKIPGDRREWRSRRAGPLPCLFVTTESFKDENLLPRPVKSVSAIAKKAETLFVNLQGFIKRVGIERVGFVTLTFAEPIFDRNEASKRFHNLAVAVLKPEGLEFVSIPERQGSGRFHFHLVAAFPCDIRTGFDFAACGSAVTAKRDGDWAEQRRWEQIYCRSANGNLRKYWNLFRSNRVRKYGFGRCETLPILSNAQALARYVGAYVTTASGARRLGDKGMRTVRYALSSRSASIRWSWADGNGQVWRRGLQVLSMALGIEYENYEKEFKEKFGEKWAWRLKETVTTFGKNYEAGIEFAAKISERAPYPQRLFETARQAALLSGNSSEILPASQLAETGEVAANSDSDVLVNPF
jgi:hypothetical protein